MSRFLDADTADKRITTVNEYLHVFPDPDPLGVRHLEGDELAHQMARMSLLALPPEDVAGATGPVGGTALAPTPQSGPALLSSRDRAAGTQDVDSPVAPDRAA